MIGELFGLFLFLSTSFTRPTLVSPVVLTAIDARLCLLPELDPSVVHVIASAGLSAWPSQKHVQFCFSCWVLSSDVLFCTLLICPTHFYYYICYKQSFFAQVGVWGLPKPYLPGSCGSVGHWGVWGVSPQGRGVWGDSPPGMPTTSWSTCSRQHLRSTL